MASERDIRLGHKTNMERKQIKLSNFHLFLKIEKNNRLHIIGQRSGWSQMVTKTRRIYLMWKLFENCPIAFVFILEAAFSLCQY